MAFSSFLLQYATKKYKCIYVDNVMGYYEDIYDMLLRLLLLKFLELEESFELVSFYLEEELEEE